MIRKQVGNRSLWSKVFSLIILATGRPAMKPIIFNHSLHKACAILLFASILLAGIVPGRVAAVQAQAALENDPINRERPGVGETANAKPGGTLQHPFILTPTPPITALDDTKPVETATAAPSLPGQPGNTGPVKDENGLWFMPQGAKPASRGSNPAPPGGKAGLLPTSSNPDDFGYTWDDNLTYSWIDASAGADTGLTGSGGATGLIDLPFNFNYYENSYSQLYISSYGYVTFTLPDSWAAQNEIPNPTAPNNVIAPYWAPNMLPSGAWVKYLSEGIEPDRHFVIEWHNLEDNLGSNNFFDFEVILHENGDIDFQYSTMNYSGSSFCAAAGIEDSTGLDGLNYIPFCQHAPSNKTVRFTRPTPSYRISMSPLFDGKFTSPAQTIDFLLTLRNTGDLGADKYELMFTSAWPASLYAEDGITLLTDTDADGFVDTDFVAQAGQFTFIARVEVPELATIGDASGLVLTATSANTPSRNKTATLQAFIPAPFSQIFTDSIDGVMSLDLVRPGVQTRVAASPADKNGDFPAVTSAPGWNLVYLWTSWRAVKDHSVQEIEYTLVDRSGVVVRAPGKLANLSSTAWYTYDYPSVVATAPNGNTGVAWVRLANNKQWQQQYNIYFAVINPAGKVISGPTNLTKNTAWWNGSALNIPQFMSPEIAATSDSRFIVVWQKEHRETGGSVDNIYYAVRNGIGKAIINPVQLTDSSAGGSASIQPGVASLTSGRVFISWEHREGGNGDIHYSILGNDGSIIKTDTNLSSEGSPVDWNNSDAVQLANGNILAVWEAWGCFGNEDWVPRLRYVLLDNSYNPTGAPQCLPKAPGAKNGETSASVTATGAQDGIFTWMDINSHYMYYALVDGSGTLLTGPAITHRNLAPASEISSSYNGYGNAPYADAITFSGNTGVGRVTLSYVDGSPKTIVSDDSGNYSFPVIYWAGKVTPSRTDFSFTPASRTYTDYVNSQTGQDYFAIFLGLKPPALLKPASNSLLTTSRPRLDWGPIKLLFGTSFDHYDLQVAKDATFNSPVISMGNGVLTDINIHEYTPDADLDMNTKYYWRVRAEVTVGIYSAWSSVRTFRTALPAPINMNSDGISQNLRPKLTWDMPAYPGTAASGYTVQVSKDFIFTQIIQAGTATSLSYTPAKDLPLNLTLFWRVRANGANGPSIWSDIASYATGLPPATPTLVSPANNALVKEYATTLDWRQPTIPFGAFFKSYQVEVAADPAFTNILRSAVITNLLDHFWIVDPALEPNAKYYWHVQACNTNDECSTWSAGRTLRTAILPPVLLLPEDGLTTIERMPVFDWEDVDGASGYTLQISKNEFFTALVGTYNTTLSTFTPSRNLPLSSTTVPYYLWRVRAKGLNGPSDWSQERMLIIIP
jgi:hypothetical protein